MLKIFVVLLAMFGLANAMKAFLPAWYSTTFQIPFIAVNCSYAFAAFALLGCVFVAKVSTK